MDAYIKNLAEKSLKYAKKTNITWGDPNDYSPKAWQTRYLYTLLGAAIDTSKVYWTIRSELKGAISEQEILSRIQLERLAKTYLAKDSPKKALEIIYGELTEEIKRLGRWKENDTSKLDGFEAMIAEREAASIAIKKQIGSEDVRSWHNMRELFTEAKIESLYFSAYFYLSMSTHSCFATKWNQSTPKGLCDFLALITPLETAYYAHRIHCHSGKCQKCSSYQELKFEIEANHSAAQ